MERLDWQRVIRTNIFVLRILGLWPKRNESYGYNFYTIYMFTTVVFFQACFISAQTVNLFIMKEDLEAVTEMLFVYFIAVAGFFKTCCLIRNTKSLKEVMITLDSDIFQPTSLRQQELVQPNLKSFTRIVSFFWFCTVGALFFWAAYPLMDNSYKEYRLPFLAWFPHKITVSPQYEFTYIYEILCSHFIAVPNVNIDMLIAALNMYIGAQFDLLCDNLKNLHSVAKESSEEVNIKLKKCIKHHKEILKFADNINMFYNWILFTQFLVSGISLGISMFRLTLVEPFSGEFYSIMIYINGLMTQIFLYCWFSEEIKLKSEKLPYAVFESDWIGFSLTVKKNLIILVLRVQKSLRISALGLFHLSLETFVKIIRTAVSYFTLLRTVNSPS